MDNFNEFWEKSKGRFILCRRTQAACGRVHTSTQHASEIAGNSIAPLVEMQGKLKYAQLSAACGMRPAAKYEPIKPTHSFYFSCGLRQSMNRPLLFKVSTSTVYWKFQVILRKAGTSLYNCKDPRLICPTF